MRKNKFCLPTEVEQTDVALSLNTKAEEMTVIGGYIILYPVNSIILN